MLSSDCQLKAENAKRRCLLFEQPRVYDFFLLRRLKRCPYRFMSLRTSMNVSKAVMPLLIMLVTSSPLVVALFGVTSVCHTAPISSPFLLMAFDSANFCSSMYSKVIGGLLLLNVVMSTGIRFWKNVSLQGECPPSAWSEAALSIASETLR